MSVNLKKLQKTAFIGIFLVLIPLSFGSAVRNGIFRVKSLEVVTTSESQPAIDGYLTQLKKRLSLYEGANLWAIDLDDVKRSILEENWIEGVKVYRRYPHRLIVEVQAKEPVAVFLSKRGSLHMISREGDLLPAIDPVTAPALPVLQDDRFLKNRSLRERVARIMRELPPKGRLSRESIGEISLSQEGDLWLRHLKTKSHLRLGEDNVVLRSARVEKVLEYLEHNNLSGRTIDADFSKKVLVRLRNDR